LAGSLEYSQKQGSRQMKARGSVSRHLPGALRLRDRKSQAKAYQEGLHNAASE